MKYVFKIRGKTGSVFKKWRTVVVFLLFFAVAAALYGNRKPLPEGISVETEPRNVPGVELL